MKPYYQDRSVTIYHGSCLNEALNGCVITDPPYGVGFKYGSYKDSPENFVPIREFIERTSTSAEKMALMMGQRQIWNMPRPKWMLCWAKPGSTRRSDLGGFNEWEPILLYGKWKKAYNDLKILPDCVNHSKDEASDHPCPKPLKLLTWLVSISDADEIRDPFMGSGTTLRAAKDLGKRAIGWDIDEAYCEIAAKRMAQEVFELA